VRVDSEVSDAIISATHHQGPAEVRHLA